MLPFQHTLICGQINPGSNILLAAGLQQLLHPGDPHCGNLHAAPLQKQCQHPALHGRMQILQAGQAVLRPVKASVKGILRLLLQILLLIRQNPGHGAHRPIHCRILLPQHR